MKRCTLILTACLAIAAGSATAQTGKLQIGAQGGVSLVSLRGNEVLDDFHRPGVSFAGGLFVQYNFTDRIALRADPGFERKGSVFKGTAYDVNGNEIGKYTSRLNYDYITLPVLVRATMGDRYKFFVNAGPYVAYMAGASQYDRGKGVTEGRQDYPYPHKDFDFGITAGAGASMPLTERLVLSAEIRNSLGLLDTSEGIIVGNGSIKTNAMSLLVGVAYNI